MILHRHNIVQLGATQLADPFCSQCGLLEGTEKYRLGCISDLSYTLRV